MQRWPGLYSSERCHNKFYQKKPKNEAEEIKCYMKDIVKSMSEWKYWYSSSDYVSGGVNQITNNGVVQTISNITQGTPGNHGDQTGTWVEGIALKYKITMKYHPTAATVPFQQLRLIIYIYKNEVTSAITGGSTKLLLTDSPNTLLFTTDQYNPDTIANYEILFDRVYSGTGSVSSQIIAVENSFIYDEIYINLSELDESIKRAYFPNQNDIVGIYSINGIYAYLYTNTPITLSNSWDIHTSFIYQYIDL